MSSNTSADDAWSASKYNTTASFVYSDEYTSPVLQLLAAAPGERIIDFGCGSGELTLGLEKVVGASGLVVGVDASEDMIKKAQSNGLRNAFVSDVQSLAPEVLASTAGTFDAVFSNAALHWASRDPGGVVKGVKQALKPGGRFVGEMGGFSNIVGVRGPLLAAVKRRGVDPKSVDPWYFPNVGEYKHLLESNGFTVQTISLHPRLTPLIGSLSDWLDLFCRKTALAQFSREEQDAIINEVEEECAVDHKDWEGKWSIMYCRLRFVAVLSA